MEVCYAENQFGKYCIPKSSAHRPAAEKVLSGGVYEKKTIAFIRRNAANGDVVHAGTYFGDFIPGVATALQTDALLWAFEPNHENFSCAEKTISLNALNNVRLHHCGLGKKTETLPFQTRSSSGESLGGASRFSRKALVKGEHHLCENVPIRRIDDVVSRDRLVSIIHLDVEGYEQSALIGAKQTLVRCKPILILEILERNVLLRSDWIQNQLVPLGYRRIGTINANTVYAIHDPK